MRQELRNDVADLQDLANLLKSAFVGKDRLIELMVTSAIAQEHLLAVGPPGTAKSELVKRFSLLCSPQDARGGDRVPYFEYLLTRFTEPAELFGPVDVKTFREGGRHRRITNGMLPRAEIAFLDEVFKANSAILNALLTVLNERVFYNGGESEAVPLVCAIAATNEVPDDPTLAALYDRFLVRVWTDNVVEAQFGELFQRGWQLEKDRIREGYGLQRLVNVTTTDALRRLYRALDEVDLDGVRNDYREVVRRIRAEGVALSDRRVIKLLKLIGASALRRRSLVAHTGDFWVLQHVWNDPEQIPHLRTIVEPYLENYAEAAHSAERAVEDIGRDIDLLAARQEALETDADYADFLQQANRLRRELLAHSDQEGSEPLVQRLQAQIQGAMDLLDQVS